MAHRLTADADRPTELMCVIEQAASALRSGELIVVPTDTVYGLACDPTDEQAARRVYELKRRDPRKPLPVLVERSTDAAAVADIKTEGFDALAGRFWPGPLTIVLPIAGDIAQTVVAGGPSVGLRAPDHPVTLGLVEHFGPIAATSANFSGQTPARSVDDLDTEFTAGVSVIVDAGPCQLKEPSTVIDLTLPEPTVLREGPVTREQLEQALGCTVRSTDSASRKDQ